MRSIMMLCAIVLVSGCAANSYCDIAKTVRLGSDDTVDWLADNDETMLRDVVQHNETRAALCSGGGLWR